MTDPISHFSRMAQMDASVRQATRNEKRESTQAQDAGAAAPARQDDEVQLSDVAPQGNYPLDSRRIAESFVALERMIKG